jgi:ElaB/YqjD/DUF883 family membrane-anchored ribosome-binding protein
MASAADKAEQRVHEQRRLIEEKIARLETQVREDVSTAQYAARKRTHDVTQSIPGRHRIEQQVEQRPLTTMAAGLAAGIGLGMLSESVSIGGERRGSSNGRMDRRSTDDHDRGDGSGTTSWLTGAAATAILGPIQGQLQDFVSAALSGLSNENARSPAERAPGEIPGGQLATPPPRREHNGPSEPPADIGL